MMITLKLRLEGLNEPQAVCFQQPPMNLQYFSCFIREKNENIKLNLKHSRQQNQLHTDVLQTFEAQTALQTQGQRLIV